MRQTNEPLPEHLLEAVHRLVKANRLRCLWFMKEDYLPVTMAETDRALTEIELHGDREAWVEARRIRAWLSPSINEKS